VKEFPAAGTGKMKSELRLVSQAVKWSPPKVVPKQSIAE